MSLFVVVKSGKQMERHVPLNSSNLPKLTNEVIDIIQADGDELEDILSRFTNIPVPLSKRVVVWNGELARFIYENLR